MSQLFNRFSFLHTISFVYLLVVVTCTESLLRHGDECLALYQFKQGILYQDYASLSSHGFQKLDSWKISSNKSINGSDCCLWDGVECSNKKTKESHVTGLDLSEGFLRIPVNSSNILFKLVYLQRLNLAMNDFDESRIPSQIGRLKELRSLNLSNARFSGQIPIEISELIQLSSLDLSENALNLRSPSLETLVRNLTLLEVLDFSGVAISSSVPPFLANFSSLRSINLQNCWLQDEFHSTIFHLPKLNFLDLAFNPDLSGSLPDFRNNSLLETLSLISTGFSGIIPESISNLNHLNFFTIEGCSFTGNIPGSVSNMSQLAYLILGQNELTGPVPSLVTLTNLTVLELSDNKIDVGLMPHWLGKLTKLSEIYLNNLNIKDEFPPFLSNLTKLDRISLRSNSICGRIPSSFMNLTQISLIDLGHNQLQGPISRSFSNFKSLERLGLYDNNFSGRLELDMFVGLNKLEGLSLGENKISLVDTKNYTNGTLPVFKYLILASCNLKKFPTFLRFQNKLVTLSLSNNEIHGLIPVWIWNNSQETLQTLALLSNYITGFHQLPNPFILPWVRLEVFFLAYNELQGRLPIPPKTTLVYEVRGNHLVGEISPLICELKSLRVLDLSSNNLRGTLPPCLEKLSNSLNVLDLKQNNFHGSMMDTFTRGSILKTIDLSENRFTGQVSKSLANCSNLEFLSLGDNSFKDVFPLWLGTLSKLQVLLLRSNRFYGTLKKLTTSSSKFLMLRIIDLSNNSFSGQLPGKSFQTWGAMKSVYDNSFAMVSEISISEVLPFDFPYTMTLTNKGVERNYERILNIFTAIDLSCNNFEGHIPQSLQDLKGLQSLNLSNNHLSGHVLPSLGNLKNLESLDLSQNELFGEIPQELLQLGFLSILNVSFNHLHGPIPQGKQFNTFENNSYMGNPRLCGEPLSKECGKSKASTLPPTSNEPGSLLPGDIIDWIVIFTGFTSGLVIGIVVGNILYARYSDWFVYQFGMRKDKWVRPLSNTRRN